MFKFFSSLHVKGLQFLPFFLVVLFAFDELGFQIISQLIFSSIFSMVLAYCGEAFILDLI